ncbi:UBA-like protein [Tanacetum coccineum]
MSTAMVCGKRSYFEEECESSPLVTKKLRCSCLTVTSSLVDRLIELYPNIHKQLLEKALQENDNNVDSVIRSFNQLCLGRVEGNSGSANSATNVKAFPSFF